MPTKEHSPIEATTIRDEWMDAVDSLINEVAAWAEEKGWRTRLSEREFNEEAIGAYEAPVLEIDVPEYDGRVVLQPVARIVLGGAGRVDLYAWPTLSRVLLLREPTTFAESGVSRWIVLTESRLKLKAEWNKQTFYEIVIEWLSGE